MFVFGQKVLTFPKHMISLPFDLCCSNFYRNLFFSLSGYGEEAVAHSETPDLTSVFSRISIEAQSTFRLDTLECLLFRKIFYLCYALTL